MTDHSRPKENKDLELLNDYSILRIGNHPEKLARFRLSKNEVYRQFRQVNENTFIGLETRLSSPEPVIESLKRIIDSYAHDLSRYVALAEALNAEAVKNAKLALSMAPIGPGVGPQRPRLSLVKAQTKN